MDVRIREIERPQDAGKELPINERVDRPPLVCRVGDRTRGPSCGEIQIPGHRQHSVAELLEIHPPGRERREQAVLGIAVIAGLSRRPLPIDRARKDEAMDGLHAPSAFDKSQGQPVQQFRVTRRLGAQTEIARRLHEPPAEMMLPNPIHHHARGQRIRTARHGFRQFEPATPLLEWGVVASTQHFGHPARHFVARTRRTPPPENTGIGLGSPVHEHEGGWHTEFDHPALHVALKLPQFLDRLEREELIIVGDSRVGHGDGRMRIIQKCPQLRGSRRVLFGGLDKEFRVACRGVGRRLGRRGKSRCNQRIQFPFAEQNGQRGRHFRGKLRRIDLGDGNPWPKNRVRGFLRNV